MTSSRERQFRCKSFLGLRFGRVSLSAILSLTHCRILSHHGLLLCCPAPVSLPCLLTATCMRETFSSTKQKLKDPRRLYAPGRLYHIVYTRYGRCKRFPAEVRTAIPVFGRFENIVCSANSTEDHSLVAILYKAQEAYQNLLQLEEESQDSPRSWRVSRIVSRREDHNSQHRTAMQEAVDLGVHKPPEPSCSDGEEQGNHLEAPEVSCEVSSMEGPQTEEPIEGENGSGLNQSTEERVCSNATLLKWEAIVDDMMENEPTKLENGKLGSGRKLSFSFGASGRSWLTRSFRKDVDREAGDQSLPQ